MTSAFSWENSISLCPVSFCTPRPNLPVTPGVSWLSTFAFQSPIMKRTSFLGVSSERSYRSSLKRSTTASSAYWLGHRLGLLWYWMVCLGNEQRSFCRFWDWIQVLHFGLFCCPWWLLHFFWGIPELPTSAGSSKKQESFRKTSISVYWLCQSLWQYGSPQTVESSERDGNTRPPDLCLEKSVCRSGSNT